MRVKLFANLSEAVGSRVVEIEISESSPTVESTLDALLTDHPDLVEHVVDDDGELREHINILVNGENVRHTSEGLGTSIDADAEIAIFPPVSGGHRASSGNERTK